MNILSFYSETILKDGHSSIHVHCLCGQVMVEVDEEGSNAAAARGTVMKTRSMPVIKPFIADHPFLFLIIDKREDVVLFFGHVVKPSLSAPSSSVQ